MTMMMKTAAPGRSGDSLVGSQGGLADSQTAGRPVEVNDRPGDTEIHDNAFVELHAYLGCRADLYAETGACDFVENTTRERTPTGSYHRNCIRDLSIEQQRRNHRRAMTEVIARARQRNELTGKQTTGIDITEGDPFYGKRGCVESL